MQQQVHSYSFQLSENLTCTSISGHPHQMSFYCSTVKNVASDKNNNGFSSIYRLNFNEENPRKSIVNSIQYKGIVQGIISIPFDASICKVFANVKQPNGGSQLKILNLQSFDKNAGLNQEGQQVFYKSENKILDLQKGKQPNLFVTTLNQILSIDPNRPNQPDSIVKTEQQKKITHSAVDSARGFIAYCLDNQIFFQQKSSKASKYSQKYTFKISPKAGDSVTNIQFNPSKQFYLMSSHHDYIKFWDIRKSNIPVKVVSEHHTLLLKAIYNNVHDELVLGCYDDGTVGLYRMQSVSSSPSGQSTDALVKLYDEHQDSVYNAAWSASPWVFSSVSYNATNIVVNIVPSVEKYRILL